MQITNISKEQISISYYDNNEILRTISLIPGCSVSTSSYQMTKPLIIYQRKGIILIESNKVIETSKESIVAGDAIMKEKIRKQWEDSGILDGLTAMDENSKRAIKLDELLKPNDKQIIIHESHEGKKEDLKTIIEDEENSFEFDEKTFENDEKITLDDIKEISKIEKKKDRSKIRDASKVVREKGKFIKKSSSEPISNADLPF